MKRKWKYKEEGKCALCGKPSEGKATSYGVELCMECLFRIAGEDEAEEYGYYPEEKPVKKPTRSARKDEQTKLF